MTLIVGYIHKEDVHVLADSATTTFYSNEDELSLLKEKSSFGETSVITDNELIEEADQKIYNYSDRVILTFAGDVNKGLLILEELYQLFSITEKNISEIVLEYFSFKNPSDVSFIIGFYEDDIGHMFAYKSPNNYELSTNDSAFVVYGSGSDNNNLVGPLKVAIIGFIKEHNPSSEELNVAIVSILQSSSMAHRSLIEGVGGFFNGSYVTNEGVKWSPDVIYLSCSRRLFRDYPIQIITKYNVFDAVFISSESGTYLHLPEDFWFKDKIEMFTEDFRKDIMEKRLNLESKYFSVISYDKIGAIIIKRHIESKKTLISLEHVKEGIIYRINSFIEKNITTPPINPITKKLDDSLRMVKLLYFNQSD